MSNFAEEKCDYIHWNSANSYDVTNLVVKKNIVRKIAGVRTTEKSIRGKNDITITEDGIAPLEITVEFMLIGTPQYGRLEGIPALEKFFFATDNWSLPNALVLSGDTAWYYDAHIVDSVDFQKALDIGYFSVKFRCNGAKRKVDWNGSDGIHCKMPYKYQELPFESTMSVAIPDNYITRKPKVVVGFSNIAVNTQAVSFKFLSSATIGKSYCGRLLTIAMPRLKNATGFSNPVLVFDFENDDYYVCEKIETNDVFFYLDKTHSLGSVVPSMLYMDGTLGNTCDYYYDGISTDLQISDLAYWHDITFRGNDRLTISVPSHTTNISAYVYYFPEERRR